MQMLPVCAVSGGETSPYSASTAFAIDPVYLGLDACEDFVAAGGRAALSDADRRLLDDVAAAATVPWNRLRPLKERGMRLAFDHFRTHEWRRRSKRARQLTQFREDNRDWIEDYACSRSCTKFDKHWREWPADGRGSPFGGHGPRRKGARRRDSLRDLAAVAARRAVAGGARRGRRKWAWI
jgi:4-alpha-glucanotransferase